jgi:hypothetical protein
MSESNIERREVDEVQMRERGVPTKKQREIDDKSILTTIKSEKDVSDTTINENGDES